MKAPEKCPKCGAEKQPCLAAVVIQFQCGSMIDAGDGAWHDETTQCIVRQRDQLAERVKRLEEAGDGVFNACWDVQCWKGTRLGDCLDQWEAAKGQPRAKPTP